MGRYPLSEEPRNPDRNRLDHEGNQPSVRLTIDFPPCRAAVGRGTVRRMVEGLVGLGVGFGCWANLEGLFLPRAPLRQSIRLPPPNCFATGRIVESPTVFPTLAALCHIHQWRFDNRIPIHSLGSSGKGGRAAGRCLIAGYWFSLSDPKLNKRLLRAGKAAQIPPEKPWKFSNS